MRIDSSGSAMSYTQSYMIHVDSSHMSPSPLKSLSVQKDELQAQYFEGFRAFKQRIQEGAREIIKMQLDSDGDALERLVRHMSDSPKSSFIRGQALQDVIGFRDDQISHYYDKAYEMIEAHRVQAAASVFLLLTVLNPFIGQIWLSLAESLEELEEIDEALFAYAMAGLVQGKDLEAAISTAECLIKLDQKEQARLLLSEILRDLDQVEGHNNLKNRVARLMGQT